MGVMKGDAVVHMAPPANRVKKLMGDLLGWLAVTDQHPLITSAAFHYEFEFMPGMILETITSSPAPQVRMLVRVLKKQRKALYREELQNALALNDRKSFRERYLRPALAMGLIEMTLPDKPNSRLQQYRLTTLGQQLVNGLR